MLTWVTAYLLVGALIGESVRWGERRLGWTGCLLIVTTWPALVLAATWAVARGVRRK